MKPADRFLCGWARSATAAFTVLALLFPLLALPAMAQETAVFTGTVFEPSGAPVQAGFKVVLKDVSSGAQYTATTDASGAYHIPVPVGGRYKLSGVTAPDGTNLPVQNVPPISAMVPGTNRLDVKFTQVAVAPPPPQPAATPRPTPPPTTTTAKNQPSHEDRERHEDKEKHEKKREVAARPWYKRPGPIVGIVLGAAAIIAIAVGSGGSSKKKASQSGAHD